MATKSENELIKAAAERERHPKSTRRGDKDGMAALLASVLFGHTRAIDSGVCEVSVAGCCKALKRLHKKQGTAEHPAARGQGAGLSLVPTGLSWNAFGTLEPDAGS